MSIKRRLSILLAGAFLLGACSGQAGTTPAAATAGALAATPGSTVGATATPAAGDPSASPAAQPTAAPSPTAAAAIGAFALSRQVWFDGYVISVTGGAYDAVKHTLAIDATFQNTSTLQTELRNLSNTATLSWSGHFLPVYVTEGLVPAGATASGQIQVQTPADFVVADAVLTFGQPDEHQAMVPLGGAAATSEQPSILAIAGKVKMGTYITYAITSAMLVPAKCSGYPDRIGFGPQKANLISIVIWGTVTSTNRTNDAHIDAAYLAITGGASITSVPTMGLSVPSLTTIPNVGMCFAVAEPGSGAYALKMHEYRSKATGTLKFLVP